MQKIALGIILLAGAVACSSSETAKKAPLTRRPVPDRLQEVYQISQHTSYPLFDCDTTINEIRIWESPSRNSNTSAFILKGHEVVSATYYLLNKIDPKKKVIGLVSTQTRVVDQTAEKATALFVPHGGLGLTYYAGVEAAIDSLFKLGFGGLQSQPEEEDLRVGDGTSYVIEVRRGSFYKYVYYHSPEYFKNEPARKFISVCRFLSSGRLHIRE
jgi:hypothetical protein